MEYCDYMIYTITTLRKVDRWFFDEDVGSKIFKMKVTDSHVRGYHLTEAAALFDVSGNVGALQECIWEHLVIEKYYPGIMAYCPEDYDPIWFSYNKGWVRCVCPESYSGLLGFAMS